MGNFSNVSPEFAEITETLLKGHAICQYRYPRLHKRLSDQDSKDSEKINDILGVMGRRIESSDDIFYAVIQGFNGRDRAAAEATFTRYVDQSGVIHEFFDILRHAQRGGESLASGDRFTFQDALSRIHDQSILVDRLVKLAFVVTQIKRDIKPPEALERCIRWLKERGYLETVSESSGTYVVTGELTLFLQWLYFVQDKEGIIMEASDDSSSGSQQQGSLL